MRTIKSPLVPQTHIYKQFFDYFWVSIFHELFKPNQRQTNNKKKKLLHLAAQLSFKVIKNKWCFQENLTSKLYVKGRPSILSSRSRYCEVNNNILSDNMCMYLTLIFFYFWYRLITVALYENGGNKTLISLFSETNIILFSLLFIWLRHKFSCNVQLRHKAEKSSWQSSVSDWKIRYKIKAVLTDN